MSGMTEDGRLDNVYRAPESELAPPIQQMSGFLDQEAQSELSLRNEYLPAESTVRTIGLIHILGAVNSLIGIGLILFFEGIFAKIAERAGMAGNNLTMFRNLMVVIMLFSTALNLALGLGLRELKNWVRWTVIVLSILGLLGKVQILFNPKLLAQLATPSLASAESLIGTALTLSMLIILFLPSSAFVCSTHYRFVVSETRHIRPKLGALGMILLGAFIVSWIVGIANAIL